MNNGPDNNPIPPRDETALSTVAALMNAAEQHRNPDGAGFHTRRLMTMGELFDTPDDDARYIVDGLLSLGSMSLLVAAPKVGKSTLARCLAVAVAKGVPWIGRDTWPDKMRTDDSGFVEQHGYPHDDGPIVVLSLEEKMSEVKRHFKEIGATGDDPILVDCDPAPENGMDWLRYLVDTFNPCLLIVDPLFRLVRVKDTNDYAEINRVLEPVNTLARQSGTHIMVLHHARKGGGAAGEEALGSTAIIGAGDCNLSMKRDENDRRTIYSRNRYGQDLEPTVLEMDQDGWIEAAGTKAAADAQDLEQNVLEFVEEKGEPLTSDKIISGLRVKRSTGKAAISTLVANGRLTRVGDGKRGDPFLFSVPDPIDGERERN